MAHPRQMLAMRGLANEGMMPIGIEQVVQAVPAWDGRTVEVERLTGGLTNLNYAVTVDGKRMFVRVPGSDTSVLAADRANELHNTMAASETGIGARVLYSLPEHGVLVLEWIDGRTMSNDAFAEDGLPSRVATSLRRLHAGRPFLHDFDMFRLTERYLGVVDQRAIPIPAGYREQMERIPEIEAALRVRPLPVVPCHNDLLAENYLDDGKDLRIVDYEYSGNGDPTFELGNTCQEMQFSDPQISEVCVAYFGGAMPNMIARMKLNMIMSDVGWGLWAAIQARISTIDFDFWGWALERWGRAVEKMDSKEFEGWLVDVQN